MITTIQIDNRLKEKLDDLKIHHRETYNELLIRMINNLSPNNVTKESLIETIETMANPEMMHDIAEAIEEYKRKRGKTLEQIEEEIGLK